MAGDSKGAISNAQKSFESALKTILRATDGNIAGLHFLLKLFFQRREN